MLRETMIALFATGSVGMLAPSVASARGGFGGGGGRLPRWRVRRRRFPPRVPTHDRHRFAFGVFSVGLGYPYAYYGD
jgi:hypothetical protein